ncbi:hypothetical protein SAMN05660461_4901 [Chitinophaga ginsengisegetis]|jgi:Contractile injection system tube protein|uniref:Contractile injection system tube protein N-terminal domain-containing protein n=1 Tax=Chitinophaga ginsengisegetis TaxID=393003 RepID=A0A1T5P8W8_9BACT|nr:hypothetical protein [Chitinophaga ginsengisegetis]MDR6568078.1 hypothetical protein [Chitinophaga ginsengisegetis]MDR6647367.1 hypothetical protein [Chitinophaga ginsengisegetis]MDR6653717.1 hypothetical protein [Chitinophaga ginsengisegetis]SKD09023.1 hypothetical protein SAMN05660461_4901 [Chitinophaga ginsengisegetis]
MTDAKVEKIYILTYSDRLQQQLDKNHKFTIPVNAETYTRSLKVDYDIRREPGSQKTEARFISTIPEELKLDFVLDGTNTIEGYGYPGMDVQAQVKLLLDTVYYMDGETHRPRFLKVFWGKQIAFPCVMSNLDLNYVLFNADGSPLRVKVSATFLNYRAREANEREQSKASPDLTHHRVFKQGDRLDLFSFKIYQEPKYMLQVARQNNLTSFKRVPVGKEIYFPPFDKSEVS